MPPIPLPSLVNFGQPTSLGPIPWNPGSTMRFPLGPNIPFSIGAPPPAASLSPMGNMLGSLQGGAARGATMSNPSTLSRIAGAGRGLIRSPITKGAGPMAGAAAIGRVALPAFAGQIAGNAITGAFGGEEAAEENLLAQGLRGAARGAGVGAAVGSVVPVIGTGAGALVGGGVGALADIFDVSKLFGGDSSTNQKNFQDQQASFQKVLTEYTKGDQDVRDYISGQVQFQYDLIRGDTNLSTEEKAGAMLAVLDSAKQNLAAYVAQPQQYRAQLGLGQTSSGPTPAEQLAMQSMIAAFVEPTARNIEATGQQQAAMFGERGAEIGGERGAALTFQGEALSTGASQIANAYRLQAQMMPRKYQMDQQQSINAQLAQQAQAQQMQGYGYGAQSHVASDPETDALLAQIAGE